MINFRLERQNASVHLKEMQILSTTIKCTTVLIEIAWRYLSKAMNCVAFAKSFELISKADDITEEPAIKKLRLNESRLSKEKSLTYSLVYKEHIHAVMGLFDVMEIGKIDEALGMEAYIKLSELTVKYFFWSLIEPGELFKLPLICNFKI